VKNWKGADTLGASDTGSDAENNSDDSCEAVVPKLNKMLENVNEVMTRLEQQTDSEHLPVLHLASVKQYDLKRNAVSSCDKLCYLNIFVRWHKCASQLSAALALMKCKPEMFLKFHVHIIATA
jgi:hypothetical protein